MSSISGATRVAAVIGDPVRHSLSPVLHNCAYRELGIDWVYVAFEVPDGATAQALGGMRAFGIAGLSLTMPHKTAAVRACDRVSAEAAALESVNTVTLEADGTLAGDSTDGEGFVRSLRDSGHDPAGVSTLLLGAGGAARAVAHALGRAGAHVTVTARRADAAAAAAALAGGTTVAWDARAKPAAAAALVVNATPVGMGGEGTPVPLDALHAGQVLADLVYHPIETPLLAGARARGVEVVDGLGMLVHQAGLQIERWTGHTPPTAAMREAARAALGRTD